MEGRLVLGREARLPAWRGVRVAVTNESLAESYVRKCETRLRALRLMLDEDDPEFENWDQDATAVEERYDEQDPDTVATELTVAAEDVAEALGVNTVNVKLLAYGIGGNADLWDTNRDTLAAHHRLILWEPRGHARSDSPEDPAKYSFARWTLDLAAVLDKRGIGRAVHNEARKRGFNVIYDLTGHGIGRRLHENPKEILNFYNPSDQRILNEGLVLAIEPFLTTGVGRFIEESDGWSLRTTDRAIAAQFEHTIVVTKNEPIILTL